jgi:F-type H+-transporting ATPase subunit alpha
VVILGNDRFISKGDLAQRCNSVAKISLSFNLLGTVVDSLGNRLDYPVDKYSKQNNLFQEINSSSPGIIDRKSINAPLQTGVLAVDSMIPIGRGQRELIIGDRQTGKTTVAVDTILNQCAP